MLGRDSEDKIDQDLCKNLSYELKNVTETELNRQARCASGNDYKTPYGS